MTAVDNDMDGMNDYPADTTCLSAGDSSESCVTTDGVALLTLPATMGDTSLATAHNDVHPTCASTTTHTANDLTYRLDVPATTTLSLSLTGSTFDRGERAVQLELRRHGDQLQHRQHHHRSEPGCRHVLLRRRWVLDRSGPIHAQRHRQDRREPELRERARARPAP